MFHTHRPVRCLFTFCHIKPQRSHGKDKCNPGRSHAVTEGWHLSAAAFAPNITARYNWSGKTHHRDQKWSEHFPSGEPLSVGEHQANASGDAAGNYTTVHLPFQFGGCPMGSAARLRADRSTCGRSERVGGGLFPSLFWQSNFKPRSAS